MANVVESYRLRSLCFQWEQRMDGGLSTDVCDPIEHARFYRGECVKCGHSDVDHEIKRCVRELRALMAEDPVSK